MILILLLAVWITYNLGGSEARENLRAIKAALRHLGMNSQEAFLAWDVEGKFLGRPFYYVVEAPRWVARPFYALKAVVCVLLGLHRWDRDDTVEIAFWNSQGKQNPEYGSYYTWDELRVGVGIFRNWFFYTTEETSA